MPVWNIARIVPVDKLSAWMAFTATSSPSSPGLGASANIYDAAEPTPRSNVTHKGGNAAPNAAQLALLEGLGTDVNGQYIMPTSPVDLTGVIAVKWDRSLGLSASPYPTMLSANNLTDQPT